MAPADWQHPRSTRILAWSFTIGAVTVLAGLIAGLLGLVVGAIRESGRR